MYNGGDGEGDSGEFGNKESDGNDIMSRSDVDVTTTKGLVKEMEARQQKYAMVEQQWW